MNGKRLTLFSYSSLRGAAKADGFLVKVIGSQILKNKDWSILEITLSFISKDAVAISNNDLLFDHLGLQPLSKLDAPDLDSIAAAAATVEQYPDHALATGTSDKFKSSSKTFQSGLLRHLMEFRPKEGEVN